MLDERIPFHEPITLQARQNIVKSLWPEVTFGTPLKQDLDWDAYFLYYTRECNTALADEGRHISARTHEDLQDIAHLLRAETSRAAIMSKLRARLTPTPDRSLEQEDIMLSGSIKLATRLLSMVNTGSLQYEVSGHLSSIPWENGSFYNAVHTHFNDYDDSETDDHVFYLDLTARNIDRVAGINIVWTDNLADHLRLVERDKKLCIFHHVSFLQYMEHLQSPIYPKDLVNETLETLTLLFPSGDRKTKQWLKGEMQTATSTTITSVDTGLHRLGGFKVGHAARRLQNYKFWRDRLSVLQEAVHEATPPSKALLKALSDRRQGDRWINSWVALVAIGLTLFFGLVQSIEGAIQVFKAYHPASG